MERRYLLKQDLLNLFINPMWVFYSTLFPFLLIVVMGYLSRDLFGEAVTSYDYYFVTFFVYCAANSATIAANSFMEEKLRAGNMRILYAPLDPHLLYRSKIIASWLFSSILHLGTAALCIPVFSLHVDNVTVLIGMLVSLELFSCIFGVLMCLLFHSEHLANQVITIVLPIFGVLGGVFFSLDRYGAAAAFLSRLSFMKWVITAAFQAVYDDITIHAVLVILVLLLGSAVLLRLCRKLFREEDCIL